MTAHTAVWTSPAPLWGRFGAEAFTSPDQARPAILRFASDEFMEQLLAMLASDPRQLGEVIARPETWRTPGGETPDLVQRVPLPRIARTLARLRRADARLATLAPTVFEKPPETELDRAVTLKLYQPAHQRHYLVAANLVCGVPGFPDRALATGGREQVGFVLRRLLPPRNASAAPALQEFAFVKDAAGPRWQRVEPVTTRSDQAARLVEGEELLPLFPLGFRDDRQHPRRLLAGVIPVGRREEYMTTPARHEAPAAIRSGDAAATAGASGATTAVTGRKEQLKLDVVEPWKNLVRQAHAGLTRMKEGTPPDAATQQNAAKALNHQLQLQSWLLLLDLADYLSTHVAAVWEAIAGSRPKETLQPGARRLFDWLDAPATSPGSGWLFDTGGRPFAPTLRDALKRVRASTAVRGGLEGAVFSYPDSPGPGLTWPSFLYPLAGIRGTSSFEVAGVHESLSTVSGVSIDNDDVQAAATATSQRAVEDEVALLDRLVPLVVRAIDLAAPARPTPPVNFAARLRDAIATTADDPGWFVLRCAYVRVECGPVHPPVLSAASQRFQLAGFFDPDAPARPIRIALPLDTTPAGLRKFNKNTAFVMSDVLCGQVQRAKGLGFVDLVRSVLPWPLHKDLDVGGMGPCTGGGATIGMICSLSIPIITICALILLVIIVTLLDLVFRWLPWFILCFPVPGLKGKK